MSSCSRQPVAGTPATQGRLTGLFSSLSLSEQQSYRLRLTTGLPIPHCQTLMGQGRAGLRLLQISSWKAEQAKHGQG